MKTTKFLIIALFLFGFGVAIQAQPTSLGEGVYKYDIPWTAVGNQTLLRLKPVLKADNNGNIWIGTNHYYGNGLIKFDGTSWSSVYSVASGHLPNNRVNCIESSGNNIYVGTDNGVTIFDGSTWTTFNMSNSNMIDSIVKCILVRNNVIWIGTNKGMSKYDGSSWINYTMANAQLINDSIQALEQTANGDVWIATIRGLSKLSGNIVTNFDTINSNIKDENVLSLRVDIEDKLWVGTNSKGLYKLIGNQFTPVSELYPEYNSFPVQVKSIAKNSLGGVVVIGQYIQSWNNSLVSDGFIHFGAQYRRYVFSNGTSFGSYSFDFNNNKIYGVGMIASQLGVLKLDESRRALTIGIIDTNNISASISNSGMLFWDGYSTGGCEVPKGSGKSTMFSANLWIGAKDNLDTLHFAGERYEQVGRDWATGPIMDSVYYNSERDKWDRIWKISKTDVDYHKNHWQESGYQIPSSLTEWPGDGDTTKGQSKQIAPYFDYNANHKYDPQNGDYPIIKGDQALFFVFNDDRNHTETTGNRLKIEVHGMAYEFNTDSDSALKNTLFINYRIYNKSQNNYHAMHLGMFSDFDNGSFDDDYIGCDSALSMAFVYNGDSIDGDGLGLSYGVRPPAMGITLLNKPMTSFMYYNNSGGFPGMNDPLIAPEYYNYMQSIWKDGTHLKYGGIGYPGWAGTTNTDANFMFSGLSLNGSLPWTEKNAGNAPNDRRGLSSTGPLSLSINNSLCFDIAYTYARDYSSADTSASVNMLKQRVSSIKNTYNNTLANSCGPEFVIPGAAGTITGVSTVCQGENAVVYSVPPITNATSYIWTLPNGATGSSTLNYITVNFGANAVSGNVTVKGYNSWGNGITAVLPVTVNPSPSAAGAIAGSTNICIGQNPVTYSVPVIANATSYVWTLPIGATGTSNSNSITVSYGTNAVSGNITVFGVNSCDSGLVSTLPISVNSNPVAAGTITGTSTICIGQSPVTYTVPTIANATSYIWTLPNGATGSSTTNSITVNYGSSAVSGNITVKGQNGCGFGVASTLPITVSSLPISSGSISGASSVVPNQVGVIYTAPSISDATSYSWTLSAGMSGNSSTNSIVANFNNSTLNDTISVKGMNSCGESTTARLVIVKEAAADSYGICYVEFDTLMSKNKIVWATPPTNAQTVNVYTEIATNTWGLIGAIPATQTSYTDMTSNPLSQSSAYRISMVDNLGVEGNKSQYHKTITLLSAYDQLTNTYGFTWSPYEGIVVPNYLLFGITTSGSALQIASLSGTSHFYNYVNPSTAFVKYFVGFYTPNCGSKTDYIVRSNFVNSISSGVTEYQSGNLVVYPNPATDQLTIEMEGNNTELKFNILNSIGQVIFEGSVTDKCVVNTSAFAAGVYMIKLESGTVIKFVK